MTDPSQPGGGQPGNIPPLPPTGYPYPPPNPGGYPGVYADPAAPFGRHPLTGEPLSDKSKVTAGLLQLLGIVGVLGVGRLYMGQTKFGVIQLIVGVITSCVGVPFVWGIIDAIILMTGHDVRDANGYLLRDGT